MKIKHLLTLFLAFSLLFALVACEQDEAKTKPSTNKSETTPMKDETMPETKAVIQGLYLGQNAEQIQLYVPKKAEGFSGPLLVNVESGVTLPELKLGDSLSITYNGQMMRSFPGQINAESLERLSAEQSLSRVVQLDINEGVDLAKIFGGRLVDIRTPDEFSTGHVEGAENLPMDQILADPDSLKDSEKPVFIYCRSGNRTGQVVSAMEDEELPILFDIGGIMDYQGEPVN